ncbi:MAG: glutathione S-transferase N-terminal domain-containing protein [Nostoc sp.]
MLTFYHAPISPNSRRVWTTLLEKRLEFERIAAVPTLNVLIG